jgi:membrane associated rhomboid family serine protease
VGQPRATWALVGICLVVYALQLVLGFEVQLAGHYNRILVADGDVWRVVTANLLHAEPSAVGIFHIGLNLIALLALGMLVERPLGTARTACVMGASGVASMLASGWFGNAPVVGVSGVVFGLAGGVLWLDYRRAEQLPAWTRFPRRSLLMLLAINGVLGLIIPMIAFAAHAGGFVAGAATTALVAGKLGTRPPIGIRSAAVGVAGMVFLATGTAGMDLFSGDDMSARYAARYARLPGISPGELNDHAWMIAISNEPTRAELEAALLLAERAVIETDRAESTILDTLAEVLWALDRPHAAVETIDEAIANEPDDPYYREQRRRFLGERAPDDRPEYLPPWMRLPEGDPEGAPENERGDDSGLSV